MKKFLEALSKKGRLAVVKEKLSPELEISSVLHSLQDQAILFENAEGSDFRIAGNLYGDRSNLEFGLGISDGSGSFAHSVLKGIRDPSGSRGRVSGFSKSAWDKNEPADLYTLPILKHFEKEAGKYITAGVVAAKFPGSEDEENLSVHRMLVLTKNKVTARIVPRHLGQIGKNSPKKTIPVTVIIGPPPSVFLASSLQVEYGLSEYRLANRFSENKLELMSSERSDVAFPVDSEIVLEGELNFDELASEGPFVDLTGTYDEVRKQPVITFHTMHYRTDSVYHAILASSREHSLFMGLPQELKIMEALSKSIPQVRGINLTPASNGYFHCVVSIEKSNDGDGKTAIMNCFAASHPLKLVIAVDSDVDPFDLEDVEWALATRFQAERGMIVVNGARGSSLDPSSAKLAVTSKLGIDATLPVKEDRSKFTRATISTSARARSAIESISSNYTSPAVRDENRK